MKIGIVGLNNWYHAKPIAEYIANHSNHEICGIYDDDKKKCLEFAGWFNLQDKCYNNWVELIDNSDAEAVLICTPTTQHVAPAEYAALKGKHIICDKPMAFSTSDCEKIIKAARKSGVVVCVLHNLRFTPRFIMAKKLLSDNVIGKVLNITYSCRAGYPEDWPKSGTAGWYADPTLAGGGGFADHAAHTVDVVLWLLDGKKPTALQASFKNLKFKNINIEDYGVAVYEFEDAIATVESSWTAAKNVGGVDYLQISGTEGEMIISGTGRPFIEYRNSSLGGMHTTHIDVIEPFWTDVLLDVFRNFAANVAGEIALDKGITGEQGLQVASLLEATYKAANSNKKIVF